jgi:capping protein beta
MEEINKLESCIKIIKKLPVSQIDKNITAISTLIYDDDDLLDNFLQKVDNRQNFCQEHCFIKSEYNRDGDSYRSPITNKYYPPMEDGRMPSKDLRSLEESLNKIFSLYTNAYYCTNSSSGICSCYCWDLGDSIEQGFAVAILIRHLVEGKGVVESGLWESTNVVNVTFSISDDGLNCTYKLTTYVQLRIGFNQNTNENGGVSGTLASQVEISLLR